MNYPSNFLNAELYRSVDDLLVGTGLCVSDMKELCMMSSRGKVHDISNPCCWLKHPTTMLKIPMHINFQFAFNIYTNTQIINTADLLFGQHS